MATMATAPPLEVDMSDEEFQKLVDETQRNRTKNNGGKKSRRHAKKSRRHSKKSRRHGKKSRRSRK